MSPPLRRDGDGAVRVAVFGTGALARVVCSTLALTYREPLRATVIGRHPDRADELSYVAQALASAKGRGATFRPKGIGHLDNVDAVSDLLTELTPDVVICCASLSSSWEVETAPSAWTELVSGAGFGITLPLHAVIPLTLAEGLQRIGSSALLVNGCYPDAVNPLLAAERVPVFCGLGNVAVIAAAIQAKFGLADQERIRVLAHHRHLYGPSGLEGEAKLWLDGQPVPDVGSILHPLRATARHSRYALIGATTARLIEAVDAETPTLLHAPGPLGHPGGYPVVVQQRNLAISLLDGVSMVEACATNQQAAAADGVRVDQDGSVVLSPLTARRIAPYLPELTSGFRAAETRSVARALLELRARLRQQGLGGG